MAIKEEILRYSRQEKMSPLSNWFDATLEALIFAGVYTDLNGLEDTGQKIV
jgi:hypothetical protein